MLQDAQGGPPGFLWIPSQGFFVCLFVLIINGLLEPWTGILSRILSGILSTFPASSLEEDFSKSVLLSIRSILDGFLVDSWWIPARGRCTGKILGDARHLPVNQAQSSPNRVPKDHPLPQDS